MAVVDKEAGEAREEEGGGTEEGETEGEEKIRLEKSNILLLGPTGSGQYIHCVCGGGG